MTLKREGDTFSGDEVGGGATVTCRLKKDTKFSKGRRPRKLIITARFTELLGQTKELQCIQDLAEK